MKKNEIKVDKKVKPLPFNERTIPELIIGNDYFVCFGSNIVRPCKLLEIREDVKMIVVSKNPPMIFKTPLLGKGAKIVHDCNVLYYDEIGLTPVQAVQNMVG